MSRLYMIVGYIICSRLMEVAKNISNMSDEDFNRLLQNIDADTACVAIKIRSVGR